MEWKKTSEYMPPVDSNTGESDWVFAYRGNKSLPIVARYSNGKYANEGWEPASNLGETISTYTGRGKTKRMTFTHWANIELPN